jgi:hypothetical protein
MMNFVYCRIIKNIFSVNRRGALVADDDIRFRMSFVDIAVITMEASEGGS